MAAAGLSITDSRREYLHFRPPVRVGRRAPNLQAGHGQAEITRRSSRPLHRSHGGQQSRRPVDVDQGLLPACSGQKMRISKFAELLTKVAMGEVDFTVADSPDFNIQRHFYPDLRVALDLHIDDPIAWGFPKGDARHAAGSSR